MYSSILPCEYSVAGDSVPALTSFRLLHPVSRSVHPSGRTSLLAPSPPASSIQSSTNWSNRERTGRTSTSFYLVNTLSANATLWWRMTPVLSKILLRRRTKLYNMLDTWYVRRSVYHFITRQIDQRYLRIDIISPTCPRNNDAPDRIWLYW